MPFGFHFVPTCFTITHRRSHCVWRFGGSADCTLRHKSRCASRSQQSAHFLLFANATTSFIVCTPNGPAPVHGIWRKLICCLISGARKKAHELCDAEKLRARHQCILLAYRYRYRNLHVKLVPTTGTGTQFLYDNTKVVSAPTAQNSFLSTPCPLTATKRARHFTAQPLLLNRKLCSNRGRRR